MNNYKSSLLASLLKLEEGLQEPRMEGKDIGYYLYESYIEDKKDIKRKFYYSLKPLIPRFIQLKLRRRYIKIQSRTKFPAWPIESIIVNKVYEYLHSVILQNNVDHIYRIGFWPDKKNFAFVITHDVEWDSGLQHAPEIAKLESDFGFVSSWNIVPERYPIDWKIVDRLREYGCEIGVHGLYHDGKLFQTERIFNKRVQLINDYASKWHASGFRSESTLRNAEWMDRLKVEYDTSFPDTDPYEPQPGGCCSIWPFFLGKIVELPLTLPQDHTLFEIMELEDISIWKQKIDWIEMHGGLVLINVHPDYMRTKERMALYNELLHYMKQKSEVWHVLPKEAAKWWRERDRCRLVSINSGVKILGESSYLPSVIETKIQNGMLINLPK